MHTSVPYPSKALACLPLPVLSPISIRWSTLCDHTSNRVTFWNLWKAFRWILTQCVQGSLKPGKEGRSLQLWHPNFGGTGQRWLRILFLHATPSSSLFQNIGKQTWLAQSKKQHRLLPEQQSSHFSLFHTKGWSKIPISLTPFASVEEERACNTGRQKGLQLSRCRAQNKMWRRHNFNFHPGQQNSSTRPREWPPLNSQKLSKE